MHIIIAIVTAIGGALWAAYYFMNAAREGGDAIRDVKGMWRAGKWSRQVSQRLVENISDPRESAAVLMYQVAAYDGAVTDAQKSAMVNAMQETFEADSESTEGLYAFSRMAVGQVEDAGNALRKLLAPVVENCVDNERRELIDLMKQVAAVEGAPNDKQVQLIDNVERRLFPK